MMGDAPGINASWGTRYKSPEPRSTYAPGSLRPSHITSGNVNRVCGSTDRVFACSITGSLLLIQRMEAGRTFSQQFHVTLAYSHCQQKMSFDLTIIKFYSKNIAIQMCHLMIIASRQPILVQTTLA